MSLIAVGRRFCSGHPARTSKVLLTISRIAGTREGSADRPASGGSLSEQPSQPEHMPRPLFKKRWDTDAETTGAVLAAHVAAAILAGRRAEQMQAALASRDRIGQAKGIIMERYGVDDVRAFEMLRLISQESQTKLADLARRVIDTRGEHS